MGLLDAASRPNAPLDETAKALESLVVRQLLTASGAFRASETPGASLHTDLFVEALADAVAESGGMGLADAIASSVRSPGRPAPAAPAGGPPVPAFPPGAEPGAVDALALVGVPGRITSGYGVRTDPFDGRPRAHHGVDIGAPEGSPIRAAADGVVRRAGQRGGYGNSLELDHGDGTSTLYAHAERLLVREGDRVQAGQEIATVGATGRATGPHLHFEVREHDRPIHPIRALRIYGERVESGSEANHDPRSRAP
jgi:murein DD-endopeptidase MepM/ murein hydrolase activator NlpD